MRGKKYGAIFRFAFIHALRNYKELVGLAIFLIACLLIFAHLWQVIGIKTGVHSLNTEKLLWYIASNQWILIAIPDVQEIIEEDLRSSRLAYLLPRPISYLGSIFMEGLGVLSLRLLVLGVITFFFTWMRLGALPESLTGLIVATLLGFLAGAVAIVFRMIVGVSAFWVQQVEPLYWIWEKFLFTFGGLMLPLALYPEILQKIAYFTPFPSILSYRSALLIAFNWQDALSVGLALLCWGVFASLSLAFFYARGLRILNLEGG
ncbi:MAG: hypothetical protein JSR76_08280 [Verrucomicrobia bacterium]|nr:hypothetical protein [Verrucomicrobiota bacterium]